MARRNDRQAVVRWWRPLAMVGGVGAAAFALGALAGITSGPRLLAAPPEAAPAAAQQVIPEVEPTPEYSRRVVARIHNKIDITREELGEYLIARFGVEKLQLLINRRIIEQACQEKGIAISPAEVEASIDKDCAELGVDRRTFVTQVLKQKNISLYEWKEDAVKPRLMLAAFCKDRIEVSEDDAQQAFESHYGSKVDVRIILFPREQRQIAFKVHEQVRGSEEEFERAARSQPNPHLAATGGQVKPVSRFSGNVEVEKIAFSLRPGELSQIIDTPEGYLIMKCVKQLPPDRTKVFENEKAALIQEVRNRKLQELIPKVARELQEKAQPVRYLKEQDTMAELERSVRQELNEHGEQFRLPVQSKNAN